ncbi:hypothetical protein MES5069_370130 [Mesorhizobium escarrei]|uniref:Uncharacterized protein n=1 Tax=Mesorhizobium escarrei TaxID=666018 RepID=A0ABN8K267_9HYPH|nr:hypothetical protein MES5069_370130 [Mesorhizobium escarrei]
MGERWLGEADTERGNAPYESPLSGRFAATSPPLRGGRGTQTLRGRQDSAPLVTQHLPNPVVGADAMGVKGFRAVIGRRAAPEQKTPRSTAAFSKSTSSAGP